VIMCPGKHLSWWALPLQMFSNKMREMLPVRVSAESEAEPESGLRSPATHVGPTVPVSPLVVRSSVPQQPFARTEAAFPQVASLVEEIVLIAHGKLDFPSGGVFLKERLAEMEKKVISRALSHTGGNISRTAELLNLQRTTLIQKLNKLKGNGCEEDQFASTSSSLAA